MENSSSAHLDDDSPISLLLVEDSKADAVLLQRNIEQSSWASRVTIDHCTNLAKASEMLNQVQYDCVLLDMGLPDGRGVGNIEVILEAYRDAAIVVLTGNDDNEAAMESLNLGAQEYAIKGMYEGEALVRILRHAIERNRMAVELRALREREWFMATHDNLTKLPNRQLFNDRAEQSLARAKRQNGQIAICFVDLDGFKPINDDYGHAIGDELLVRVAKVFEDSLRETDTVARIGGDEFVLLVNPLMSLEQAETICQRVIEQLKAIGDIEGNKIQIGASIGIATYPEHGEDMDHLMRNADVAMYASKRGGKGQVKVYAEGMLDD